MYGKRPFKKSYPQRKNYKKRSQTPWYNKKYSPMDLATKAMQGVNSIRKLINVEHKKFDTTMASVMTTSGSTNWHLTAIAEGDDINARNGRSILVRFLHVKGRIAIGELGSIVRVICVRDLQQVSDTVPAIGQILETTDVNSFSALAGEQRFEVLYDKRFYCDLNATNQDFHFNATLQSHVKYNSTLSTDIQKGGIYLFVFTNGWTTIQPAISAQSRVVFTDN